MGTLRMVQLATIVASVFLVSLVSTQQADNNFNRQRLVWQEQIDKVKQAEEELKVKRLPDISSIKKIVPEVSSYSEELNKKTYQLGNQELKSEPKSYKQETSQVRAKPILTSLKTKSKYILEAERFLQKSRQRKPSNPVPQSVSAVKVQPYKYSAGQNKKEESKYHKQAEKILKNISGGKTYSAAKTSSYEPKNIYKYESKSYELEKENEKENEKLDQNEIKDLLIDNISTKDGLKEIIKVLLQQTYGE